MSNKFFHLALSAIAPLAVVSTVAFTTPAVAAPDPEPARTTATHPAPIIPSAVHSNTLSNPGANPASNSASNPDANPGSLDRNTKAANAQTNPAVSRGITLTISPEALIIGIITLMFIAGAVSHRKYKRQRVLTLQEQIQLLEKIWRMTPQR